MKCESMRFLDFETRLSCRLVEIGTRPIVWMGECSCMGEEAQVHVALADTTEHALSLLGRFPKTSRRDASMISGRLHARSLQFVNQHEQLSFSNTLLTGSQSWYACAVCSKSSRLQIHLSWQYTKQWVTSLRCDLSCIHAA